MKSSDPMKYKKMIDEPQLHVHNWLLYIMNMLTVPWQISFQLTAIYTVSGKKVTPVYFFITRANDVGF